MSTIIMYTRFCFDNIKHTELASDHTFSGSRPLLVSKTSGRLSCNDFTMSLGDITLEASMLLESSPKNDTISAFKNYAT